MSKTKNLISSIFPLTLSYLYIGKTKRIICLFFSHILTLVRWQDEEPYLPIFLSLTHTCTLVRRRALFAIFLSLFHTFTSVRRRALFACFSLTHSHLYIGKTKSLIFLFFSHSFTHLGEGGGFSLYRPESHQYLKGERVWFAPPLFYYFFLIVLT